MLLKQSIIKYKTLLYQLLNKNFPESRKIINKYEKYQFMLQINKNDRNIAFYHTNVIVILKWSFNFVKKIINNENRN
jgi:hypothetical protein